MNRQDEDQDLQAVGERIARTAHPRADDALRARLHASLMSAPVVWQPRVSRWRILRPVTTAALALALVGGGAGYAAASSLPGDPAFALKAAFERVELSLAFGDDARLAALVRQSERRLLELERAVRTRPASVNAAARAYEAASVRVETTLTGIPERSSGSAIDETSEASGRQLEVLDGLRERLPVEALPGIDRAIEAQEAVHGRSDSAPGRLPSVTPPPIPSLLPDGVPLPSPSLRVPPGLLDSPRRGN